MANENPAANACQLCDLVGPKAKIGRPVVVLQLPCHIPRSCRDKKPPPHQPQHPVEVPIKPIKNPIEEKSQPKSKAFKDNLFPMGYVPKRCRKRKYPTKPIKRPQSHELRASINYSGCDCGKFNGLQDDCRRSECQGCPRCKTFPPKCDLSQFSNARHLTRIRDEGMKKRCPFAERE